MPSLSGMTPSLAATKPQPAGAATGATAGAAAGAAGVVGVAGVAGSAGAAAALPVCAEAEAPAPSAMAAASVSVTNGGTGVIDGSSRNGRAATGRAHATSMCPAVAVGLLAQGPVP